MGEQVFVGVVQDLGEEQLNLCYAEFRKHCIQRHDLQGWDVTSYMHLDLEHWILTFILKHDSVLQPRQVIRIRKEAVSYKPIASG